MRPRFMALVVLLVSATAPSARGQNLLSNPGFLELNGLSGYTQINQVGPNGTTSWDGTMDAGGGQPSNGSAKLSRNNVGITYLRQCVSSGVAANTLYSFGGKVFVPSLIAAGSSSTILVTAFNYTSADCSTGASGATYAISTLTASWESVQSTFTTQAGASSISIAAEIATNDIGGSTNQIAFFDDMFTQTASPVELMTYSAE